MSIADQIKEQIASHKIKMRPRAYFIAGAAMFGVGFFAAIVVSVFFIGIIIFRFRVNAPFAYLNHPDGLLFVLENIPWIPLVIAFAGITAGILMMRKFEFSYKHAFVGVFGGFLVATVAFGIVVDATGITERAERFEELQPFLHVKYVNDKWVAGTVTTTTLHDEVFELETPQGMLFTVRISSDTIIIPPDAIMNGEWVRVIGDRDNAYISAEQIMHQPTPRRSPQMNPNQGHFRVFIPR